jgi:hypothetical protein
VVIKGNARGGAGQLARHLERTDTNERIAVRDVRGVVAGDVLGALNEMDGVASGTRCTRPLYHASINTAPGEEMTDELWNAAIDRLEAALGFTGQPRVIVEHGKKGREHVHIVWSRIDLDRMRAIPDSHNYRKHEEVARELEREFGHARVQGAHAERDGQPRPERTPSHAEMQQAERSGLRPEEAKAQITEIWRRTDSGQAFAAAITEAGWILARGDKRDFVVIDSAGEAHSLARRVDGVKAADVRARMADVDRDSLPRVQDARAMQEARQLEREAEIDADRRASEAPAISQTPPEQPRDPVQDQRILSMERDPPPPESPTLENSRGPAQTGGDSILSFGFDLLSETIHNAAEIGQAVAKDVRFIVDELNGPQSLVEFADKELERRGDELPPRQISPADFMDDPGARQEYYAQRDSARGRDEALDRMQGDIQAERNLKADDVRALSRPDLEGIRDKGDEHLVTLIDAREQVREQALDRGLDRER